MSRYRQCSMPKCKNRAIDGQKYCGPCRGKVLRWVHKQSPIMAGRATVTGSPNEPENVKGVKL